MTMTIMLDRPAIPAANMTERTVPVPVKLYSRMEPLRLDGTDPDVARARDSYEQAWRTREVPSAADVAGRPR
jgi:hypothetical protein